MQQQLNRRKHIRIPRLIRTAAEETLRQDEAIQAVLLYGSRARGDHRRGSDWDIAVVSSLKTMEAFETAKLLYDVEVTTKHWTELAFTSPENLERYANTAGTLEARIAREGILIAGDWTRPTCREGNELDVDSEKALNWSEVAMGMGTGVTSWLEIASSEDWKADNEASARVQRMAVAVVKGIVATFGIHESDIHDLDRTADELETAYEDTGWRQAERSQFAGRIRAIKSTGRAALRAEKWRRPFEPLDETIERLGKVFTLLIQWLTCHATHYPETEENMAELARRLESYLERRGAGSWLQGVAPELIEHVQKTWTEAEQLAAKLGTR